MRNAIIESLEGRRLLAGDVSVFANAAGQGQIVGDDQPNTVTLESDGNGGTVARGTDGTTINGGTDPVPVGGLHVLHIDLHDGRDELLIDGADLAFGDVRINTGDGNDAVLISESTTGNITFDGGLGKDWLIIQLSTVADFNGNGGAGHDQVELNFATFTGHFSWNDRSGPGNIRFWTTDIHGTTAIASVPASGKFPVAVNFQHGTFTSRVAVSTGNGDDTIFEDSSSKFVDGLDIFTGDGADRILPPWETWSYKPYPWG